MSPAIESLIDLLGVTSGDGQTRFSWSKPLHFQQWRMPVMVDDCDPISLKA